MTTIEDVRRASNVYYLPVKRHNHVWQSAVMVAGVLSLVIGVWLFVAAVFSLA